MQKSAVGLLWRQFDEKLTTNEINLTVLRSSKYKLFNLFKSVKILKELYQPKLVNTSFLALIAWFSPADIFKRCD